MNKWISWTWVLAAYSVVFVFIQNIWFICLFLSSLHMNCEISAFGGVGIASSDIMSYQMYILIENMGRGLHVKQCSNHLIWLYSGLSAATGLEVDQITYERKILIFTHFSHGIQCLYLFFILSFLHCLSCLSSLALCCLILYWYLCCALALLWRLLVEPGGARESHDTWGREWYWILK